MANFKPLPLVSQSSGNDVLHFDAAARPTDLYESLTGRLFAARDLLDAIASCPGDGVENARAVATAVGFLLSDASGMLEAIYDVLREHQQIMERMPEGSSLSLFKIDLGGGHE